MQRLTILLGLSLLLLTSCQTKPLRTNQKIRTIKKLDCMLGKWVTFSSLYMVVETWKKVNDTTLKGNSIMIMEKDTVLNEKMTIQPGRSNIYFYSKNLMDPESEIQNFKLQKIKSKKIIFEKLGSKTDFITYNFITPETLRILIENDKKSIESYNMKKIIK